MFITARTLRYINIHDVYITLRPCGFESLISSKTQKTRQAGFLGFGEARGTFAYASHPPLCTARSGRLEPLAAVMSNGHYVYTLAPFRVRTPRNVRNVKNPTSGFLCLARHEGLSRMLRIRRSAPPVPVGLSRSLP